MPLPWSRKAKAEALTNTILLNHLTLVPHIAVNDVISFLHGNHRAASAVKLGLEEVPVRIHKAEYCELFRDWLYPTFEKPGRAMYKRKRWPK